MIDLEGETMNNLKEIQEAPVQNNFVLVPRGFNQLKSRIENLHWNVTEKILGFCLYETPDMDGWIWLQYLNKLLVERQTSPFIGSEHGSVGLILVDKDESKVATFVFKNLSILRQDLHLVKKTTHNLFGRGNDPEPLAYHISLRYDEVDLIKNIGDEDIRIKDVNRMVDEDWNKEFKPRPKNAS